MKSICPDCNAKIDLDVNKYEEGDPVSCPDCGITLIIKVKGGKFRLKTEKEEFYDAADEEVERGGFYEG